MKKISIFTVTLLVAGICGCSTTKNSQPALGTIGGDPIQVKEFNYVYSKNNSNSPDSYSKESIEEYLKLYTNFRLKVKAAEDLGLDTSIAFKSELEGYRKQLAQPYLSEKQLTEQYTKEAYERLKEEINASHILISVGSEANPDDTLKAWKKITEIKQRAAKGEDFAKLAREYSEDPSAKTNSGNLGYFTALQMVYPFEDAAYNTKVGEISDPVRTRFGYHILKVHNRRPSQGQVKVAHLMVRFTEGMPASDSLAAKQKIDELYKKLKQGENWDELVKQFSDDINTREKGGELQWFSTGRMIPSFEEAAFAIQNIGDFSEPVQTPYGWHVIKLLERKGLESFEELEPKIKSKVSRDRAEINKKVLIARLKKENNFEEYPLVIKKIASTTDSSILQGKWKVPANAQNDAVLFIINKEKYSAGKFYDYVLANQKPRIGSSPESYMMSLYEDFKNSSIIQYEEMHLGEKYEDYKMLVKEYRDGILLFQLMDEKVWSKAIEDTAGLRIFFEKNREKYKWGERAKAVIFNAANAETIEKVKVALSKDFYQTGEPELEPLYFSANSDSISGDNLNKLNRLIPYLANKKELVIKLGATLTNKENPQIAAKRIQKVKSYLASKNIDTVKIISGDVQTSQLKASQKETEKDRKVTFQLLSTSAKSLEKQFNSQAPLTLQVTEGTFQKGDNEILDGIEWKPDTSTFVKNDRYYLVIIEKIEEPRLKRLEETRGAVISDYQEYLEKQWIEELKAKYPVSINQEEVNKLIKN